MKLYRNALSLAYNKEIDLDSDTLFWTLHTSAYTPNLDTHIHVSDLTNELSTGGGYTSGGLALTSPLRAYTVANSWGVVRANSTAYNVGDVYRPSATNGFLYRCSVAGTSAAAPPTFTTVVGTTFADGTATFDCVGSGIFTFTCANPVWASATFGPCRYAVLSDKQTGVASTEPLLGYIDFLVDKTGGGGNFTINLNTSQGVITTIAQ
jgi:hypothetical protein